MLDIRETSRGMFKFYIVHDGKSVVQSTGNYASVEQARYVAAALFASPGIFEERSLEEQDIYLEGF